MQNLYYFRSARSGRRLLFGACEVARIEVAVGGVVIYTYSGCPYVVTSSHPELVVKEPPRQTGPDVGHQFNRYEKLVQGA